MTSKKRALNRWFSIKSAYWLIVLSVVSSCVALRVADPGFMVRLRLLGFDLLQQVSPRAPNPTYPVRIIDIDERSLEAHGSWPWRRDVLAELVDKLFGAGVRIVVFDVVFPSASVAALDQLPPAIRDDGELKPLLDKLRSVQASPDAVFANAIADGPTVLGIIGTSAHASNTPPSAKASFATVGETPSQFAPSFTTASSNLAALEKSAAGIGVMNWLPDHDQILRRIPTVVTIDGRLYPSLAIEALRVFKGVKTIGVRSAGDGGFGGDRGITSIAVGDTRIPTDQDGQLWLSFSRHDPKRAISARDVLSGTSRPEQLKDRIAIIGTSAPGLLDLRATPLDPVISGVEIHAQALEQLLANRLLVRPDFAKGLEIVLAVVAALMLAAVVYLYGARNSAAAGFMSVCALFGGSLWAFNSGLLLDAIFPVIASTAAYIFGTGYLYYEAESERNRSREALRRIAQEMESAAQIQRTFLPKDVPTGPMQEKFDLFAVMKPAKSVGGDFFDYFLINERKLGFVVGDVSGKGVPAALFMSVSRTVLRTIAFEDSEPGETLSKVNTILARDNSEGMFVTIFYAVLDLQSGRLAFSSAGHDDALYIDRSGACERLNFMAPAIGLFEEATFPTATRQLDNGDTIMLLTDGITEAFSIDGRVFSADRVVKFATRRPYAGARDLVVSLADEVERFSEGTDQSDDITCVAMRFMA